MNWLIGITGFLIAAWVLSKVLEACGSLVDEFNEMLEEFLRGLG